MKKLFSLIAALLFVWSLSATEYTLLSSDAKAEFEGYDYVSNFEITSESGYFTKDDLKILEPNEKGFRFMATNVPMGVSTSYVIKTPFPSFFNESGSGSGFIDNAGAIKQIKVVGRTNRPYDEISILYRTASDGIIHSIKMPQDFNSIRSMEEFELVFDNPLYEPDVNKREIKASPVLGNKDSTIELVGIRIKTNAPDATHSYSPYSIVYLKSITVVCDSAFTDSQLEERATLLQEFGIVENEEIRIKTSNRIKELIRIKDNEKSLMDSGNSDSK